MIALFLTSLMLPPILIIINMTLFKKPLLSREKMNPFECGFDPQSTSRIPFSIKFYLIAIIFLIFDIEIAIMLPIPLTFLTSITFKMNLLIIFMGGLLYEWSEGALKWLN